MTFNQVLRVLRWQIAFAVVLVALGAAALYAADKAFADAEARLAEAERIQRSASARLLTAQTQETEVREAIDVYGRLNEAGLVGPEQRLLWVETLDMTRKRLGIENIRYEILPQRALATEQTRQLSWMESRMRISMELPHGQALLDLMAALMATPTAVVQPRQCELERQARTIDRLRATCELRWLTLQRLEPAS